MTDRCFFRGHVSSWMYSDEHYEGSGRTEETVIHTNVHEHVAGLACKQRAGDQQLRVTLYL